LILKPGQRGTKSLAKQYGNDLLCVRFRYDARKRQRLKTVELIVERTPWSPPKPEYADDATVHLRIRIDDMQARSQTKAAGGRWDPDMRLWRVKYARIAGTLREKHICRCIRRVNSKSQSIYMYMPEKYILGRCRHIPVDACIYM
jgi:hypothetical protein